MVLSINENVRKQSFILIGYLDYRSGYPDYIYIWLFRMFVRLSRQSLILSRQLWAINNAGCTFLQSAFGKNLGQELPKTRLGECDSLHSWRELSVLVHDTRRQSDETRDPLTRAYGPLKKQDLNEARHERRGYTRGSKARRVFPSTLSLSSCLGFPRRECTASITFGLPFWLLIGPSGCLSIWFSVVLGSLLLCDHLNVLSVYVLLICV